MSRRGAYLCTLSPEAAWAKLAARVRLPDPPAEEEVDVTAAAGRIIARPTRAARSSPSYHGAAMDGFAVRAADTLGAAAATPVALARGTRAIPIDTGDPLPPGCDAVVKIEDVQEPDGDTVEIAAAVAPWQHVRLVGEDVVVGDLVVPRGKTITPFDVGALFAAGLTRVWVRRRPRVALVPTGDELVEPGAPVVSGSVIEFNTHVLAALVREWGGEPIRLAPVPDDRDKLIAVLSAALADSDVVVVNAGSSAGRDDHTAEVLAALGELLVHGLAVMPGKPTAVAVTPDGKAILGLPGYPVSCVVAAERLLRPLVALHLGCEVGRRERVTGRVARKVAKKSGYEEVLRVTAGLVEGGWVAAPLTRGAGVITSLSRANGLVTIAPAKEGLEAGATVEIELLVPRAEAELTIVHVGSHDLALDLLGDILRVRHPGRVLASANVGSLGGLYALDRGECHVAGTHLLDPETGDTNRPYVARVCRRRPVLLATLVHRAQGWTVRRGNPKGIRSVEDLARGDVTLVNRQRGAGTRVLLDAELAKTGLSASAIHGYDHEEHTHMAAAVAVASGIGDVALTIRAAAAALELDFIPLCRERYDLAFAAEDLERPYLCALVETMRSAEFRRAAEALPGYSAAEAGALVPMENS